MYQSAVFYGMLAMVGWGIWSVLAKLATRAMAPPTAMVISYGTGAFIVLGFVLSQSGELILPRNGVLLAAVAGIFAGIGGVSFYMGLSQGRAAVVTTISALYFGVAALIGIFVLGESIDAWDIGGMGFAILAVIFLTR